MKPKNKKRLKILALILFFLGTLSALEELTFVHPKEEALNKALSDSTEYLSKGMSFEEVERKLTRTASDIGVTDINIHIIGEQLYGQVIKLTLDGRIEANTVTRKLLNRTQQPYKASIETIINKL